MTWVAFAMLLLFAIGLRLYGLGNEAPWFDEVLSFHFNTEEGLGVFLDQVTVKSSPVSPLFFVLNYGWMKLFGDAPVTIRYLCVLLSTGSLIFFFLLAKNVLGNTGSLLALSFMAFSEYHIYYAQEIRMYPLVLCMAAFSLWSFQVNLKQQSTFWLMLNIVANALLMWTHLYGVFLIMAQGITYLILRPRAVLSWFTWGLGHIPHGLIFFLWYFTRNHKIMDAQVDWIGPANHITYLQFLTWNHTFLPETWAYTYWGKYLLLPVFILALTGLLVSLFKAEHRKHSFYILALCLPLLLLPLLIVFVAEHLGEHLGITRYFIFASMGMYLLLAAAVIRIPYKPLRYSVIVAMLIFSISLAITIPRPFRSDWAQANLQLDVREKHGDVFLMDRGLTQVGFEYNVLGAPRLTRVIPDRDERRKFLIQLLNQGRRVWLIQLSGHEESILVLPTRGTILLDKLRLDGKPGIEISLLAPKEKAGAPSWVQPQRKRSNYLSK